MPATTTISDQTVLEAVLTSKFNQSFVNFLNTPLNWDSTIIVVYQCEQRYVDIVSPVATDIQSAPLKDVIDKIPYLTFVTHNSVTSINRMFKAPHYFRINNTFSANICVNSLYSIENFGIFYFLAFWHSKLEKKNRGVWFNEDIQVKLVRSVLLYSTVII